MREIVIYHKIGYCCKSKIFILLQNCDKSQNDVLASRGAAHLAAENADEDVAKTIGQYLRKAQQQGDVPDVIVIE